MVTLAEAKEKIRVQRESLARQRSEAESSTKLLEEQKAKIPVFTQRALRTGNLSGLNGLRKRAAFTEAKKGIEQKQDKVNILLKELARYESEELIPYEKNVSAYEKDLARYQKELKQYYKDTEALALAEQRAREKYSYSSGASKVVSPSYVFKTSPLPSKITVPSSILNSGKSSTNSTKKKSIFSWRK